MEKLAFALVMVARKLRPYFQAHTIIVLTNQAETPVFENPGDWNGAKRLDSRE